MSLRILHIGVGDRGRHWLDIVASHPDASSVACVDADEAALAKAREKLGGAPGFTDLAEALGAGEANAAVIASPSKLHVEHALACLDAGLAVLIEKPFAPGVGEARRVIAKGEAVGKPVVVAEQFRYVPAERTVRKLVLDGKLGQVSNAVFSDRRRMPPGSQGPWVKELEFPQLQEVAVHHFDSLHGFFDRKPVSVCARAWNPPGSDYPGAACSEALIEMQDGLHVQYLGTLTSNKFAYQLRIEGDAGDLWTNRKLVTFRPKGKKLFLPVKNVSVPRGDEKPYPFEGTTSLLDGLRDALAKGIEPETAGKNNVWAIATVQAAMLSARERRTVDLVEVDAAP